jgi:hypothetical protein
MSNLIFQQGIQRGCRRLLVVVWAVISGAIVGSIAVYSEDARAHRTGYGPARRIAALENDEITESSGLAVSRRQTGLFWTHNDSGDEPRLFAFDRTGKSCGACLLQGAAANDWEDMASFERGGKNWLLLGDVGDNGLRRKSYELYLCEEPAPTAALAAAQRIRFRYEHGSQNCEAVGVDAIQGIVLLSTKIVAASSDVFQLPIPDGPPVELLVARKIATIPVGSVVAMDVSPDGLRAVVLTYGDAFEFFRAADEDWQRAFARPPRRISMPLRRQGETICYGADGRSLFLTSERRPVPLWEVPWVGEPSFAPSAAGR